MDALLDWTGPAGLVAAAVVAGLPLVVLGWRLRRAALAHVAALTAHEAVRRPVEVRAAGPVALAGRWRGLGGGGGLVEDEHGAVLVARGVTAPLDDGARVVVLGRAVGEVDDPRLVDYRARPRLWRVEAEQVTRVDALPRARRRARRRATLAAALFSLGLAMVVGAVAVAVTATAFEARYGGADD